MKPKLFIIITAVVVLSLSLFAPSLKVAEMLGWVIMPEMGNIIEPEKTYGNIVMDTLEYAKASVSDTYINYLPAYAQIVTGIQTAEVKFNQPFNDFLSSFLTVKPASVDVLEVPETPETESIVETTAETEAETEPPESEQPYITSFESRFLKASGEGVNYYAIDAEYSDGSTVGLLTTAFNTPAATYTERMRRTAEQINAIAAANTDVNVWVYVCSRLQDSENFSDIIPGEPSLYPLVTEFFGLLDERIGYDRFKIDSLEDSVEKLFKTDHHWNAYGMYEAYTDIVKLIYGDGADEVMYPLGTRCDIEDADFYGTFARTSGYYEYCDEFFFYDYDLPKHALAANSAYDFDAVMERYLNGEFSKDIGTDHYANFYPYTRYVKYPDNDTGRVLLLLGDSYSRGISELLCSAFDAAYVFDYRRIGEIGNYNEFIAEKGITDVLFMQYSLRGVFDNQNDNTLDLIGLD